ncbi:hypothetical protein [Victivallis sp. Marseille-Q1083]|uniref:hypothetical protein n=1 Tax=Victivallis sp. Marseille-Q1083 TaxID=2717288 RepID=UPI00158BBA16|nr:hypothetical protein [Victivallis sp. Marseille-Q1083]
MENDHAAPQRACPNCGNSLEFDPQSGSLYCRHCAGREDIAAAGRAVEIQESDYNRTLAELQRQNGSVEQLAAHCANCGAEVIWPPLITADRCPYCDSPIVEPPQMIRQLAPGYLLPFKLDQETARRCFRKWLKGRWFLPDAVKRLTAERPFDGIYLPFWTYDCRTRSRYQGMRGDYYYVTVHYTVQENGKTVTRERQERRTRWHSVGGCIDNRFDDILVAGSRVLPAGLLEELEPWDFSNLVPYDSNFLRGFKAEVYAVELDEGFEQAKEKTAGAIRAAVCSDIGGDEQRITSLCVDYREIRFKYLLLPIYLSAFRWHDKLYRLAVNARTGEVQGERPWSWIKILAALLAGAAICGILWLMIDHGM